MVATRVESSTLKSRGIGGSFRIMPGRPMRLSGECSNAAAKGIVAMRPASANRARRARAMSHELDPKVGRWYQRLDNEQLFKVVAIDEDDGLVEIRMTDGEIEELDATEWVEL